MAIVDRSVLDDFTNLAPAPSGVAISKVYHPDLDEMWIHYTTSDKRATVSFADDDDLVYVVLREPEKPRRVLHESTHDAARTVCEFLT